MSEAKLSNTIRESSYIKQHLLQQIDNLKIDIQNLIDNRKNLDKKEDIESCNALKQQNMEKLKSLNNKLKEVIRNERYESQKQNEISMLSKAIDNMEFGSAKKRNNGLAMDKAKQEKQQRENIKMKYLEYQEDEKKYLQYDSSKYPGSLFLSKNILKSYGLCPYLDLDLNNLESIDSDSLDKNRLSWLKEQSDNGTLYFDLYDDLIDKKNLIELQKTKLQYEKDIDNFLTQSLTDSQNEYLQNSIVFLEKYVNCMIKTKRIKEQFKIMINNMSILFSETNLEIHSYLSIRFDITLVVNIIDSEQKISNFDKLQSSVMIEYFNNHLEKYKTIIESIGKKEKYVMNTLKNLKLDLYNYLIDKENFIKNENILSKKSSITQVGKYFEKWSSLSKEQKLERLESFSIYYIDKHLIETRLLDTLLRDTFVNTLYNLLKNSLESKNLVYKNISWNVKKGVIDYVKILQYDNDNKTFKLNIEISKDKFEKSKNNDRTTKDGVTDGLKDGLKDELKDGVTDELKDGVKDGVTDEVKDPTKNIKTIKKVSTKQIITKDTEKIINEELLHFILKRIQNGINEILEEDFQNFLERIKIKLRVKKLSSKDTSYISDKYKEIFEVVKNNV
jgi:hypothetical protein